MENYQENITSWNLEALQAIDDDIMQGARTYIVHMHGILI